MQDRRRRAAAGTDVHREHGRRLVGRRRLPTSDCTLREAIVAANGQAGANTIEFDIADEPTHIITPQTALPTITEEVTIDGTTEPDYAGIPVVELNGTVVSAGDGPWHGLRITGNDSVVRGLAINRFALVGAGVGIEIVGGDRTRSRAT